MRSICVSLVIATALAQSAPSPQNAVDELLAADRSFAAAAAKTTVIPALSAMFADEVAMPTPAPAPGFARGKDQAIKALEANPDNTTGRVEWWPARGGISADGRHGFTVGYMTLRRENGTSQPIKYVAYWIKKPEGWRVAVYKRVLADASPSTQETLAPAVPAELVAPTTDAATIARHEASLEAAEHAFSADAQKIGLGPAFARHGSADAMNVGPRTSATFVVGAAAIGKAVGAGSEGKPSPLAWAPDEGSMVASSGDLGVTFGYIRPNAPQEGQSSRIPFITIWRRAGPNQPWRYVAE
jgi:hypothetical protein